MLLITGRAGWSLLAQRGLQGTQAESLHKNLREEHPVHSYKVCVINPSDSSDSVISFLEFTEKSIVPNIRNHYCQQIWIHKLISFSFPFSLPCWLFILNTSVCVHINPKLNFSYHHSYFFCFSSLSSDPSISSSQLLSHIYISALPHNILSIDIPTNNGPVYFTKYMRQLPH